MRTWLITGCSSGVGRGIAKAALENGDRVCVTARKIETVQNFAEDYPETALVFPLDLKNEGSMKEAVRKTQEKFGAVDVLVNNAGYGYRAAIEENEDKEVRRLFETNVFGPTKLMNMRN